mmetsp:Transcript_7713/g.17260  ORF Transcript_7713/g.17260 Transcript_7713/m.17260 type:complete len:319 (-) Transcript_7713:1082-2038(-)
MHAVDGAVVARQPLGHCEVGRRRGRERVRDFVERWQHIEHIGRLVVQHGDRHVERLEARQRMTVAHGPALASGAVGLEDDARLIAAAEEQLNLAARHQVGDALEHVEVLRLARLVQLQHRVLHLLRPELSGLPVGPHPRDDQLDPHRLPVLLLVEEHRAKLTPRESLRDAHGVVLVVVDDELVAARVAAELARVVYLYLVLVPLAEGELVHGVLIDYPLEGAQRIGLVVVVETHRQRVAMHAHPQLLLVHHTLNVRVHTLLGTLFLRRLEDGRVDEQTALIFNTVLGQAESLEHPVCRSRRRHLQRLRDGRDHLLRRR